jgi:hypothetical protein
MMTMHRLFVHFSAVVSSKERFSLLWMHVKLPHQLCLLQSALSTIPLWWPLKVRAVGCGGYGLYGFDLGEILDVVGSLELLGIMHMYQRYEYYYVISLVSPGQTCYIGQRPLRISYSALLQIQMASRLAVYVQNTSHTFPK